MNKNFDIVIIGGGITGASLLLALQKMGLSACMVDARPLKTEPEAALDARSLALAPASLRILRALGVSIEAQACAIESIHVSQQGRLGISRLPMKTEPLGQVIELSDLNQRLLAALGDSAEILAPATFTGIDTKNKTVDVTHNNGVQRLHYQLLVAADGMRSPVRKALNISAEITDYQQTAIVCNIGLARSHQHVAYERFTHDGPLAMLPLHQKRAALVWAMRPSHAQSRMELSDQAFLSTLQSAFGYRLGRLSAVGCRYAIPLLQVYNAHNIDDNVVFIGSAAQHLHPVAGQGFNLALRDVASLVQCVDSYGLNGRMLRQYQNMRQTDRKVIGQCTDALVRVFGQALPGAAFLRSLGLLAFDTIAPVQDVFARYARGFGGTPPDMACGIPLQGEQYV